MLRRGELTSVYVLDAQQRPLLRPVRLATPRGDSVEVISGLRAGERVVADPAPCRCGRRNEQHAETSVSQGASLLLSEQPADTAAGLVALLLGVFAVLVTPREEEPQIDVTMAQVFVAWPGANVADVEAQVASPAERVLSQMAGSSM